MNVRGRLVLIRFGECRPRSGTIPWCVNYCQLPGEDNCRGACLSSRVAGSIPDTSTNLSSIDRARDHFRRLDNFPTRRPHANMEALASGSMCYAARMMRFLLPILALGNITAVAQTANQGTVQPTQTPTVNQAPRLVMAETPNTDLYYKLAPDAVVQEGVPKGEIRGPFTLPSQAYPGTQHTYWVYVPAQYDTATPASLMIYNDGQAFKAPEGDVRAPVVMDNLIYRREIPVMIAVFINPGRRTDQPEPVLNDWGDRSTNRPTEYNSLDDKYARVIVDELMPVLHTEYNISKDPERHGIGGAATLTPISSGRARRSRFGCFSRMAATTTAAWDAMAATISGATGSTRTC